MQHPPPTPQQLARARELLASGHTWTQAATEVGRSEYALRKYLPNHSKPRKTCRTKGCNRYVSSSVPACPTHDVNARRERQRAAREATILKIVELRERGMLLKDIAPRIGISKTRASQLSRDPSYEDVRQRYFDALEEELALLDGWWRRSPTNPMVRVWVPAA